MLIFVDFFFLCKDTQKSASCVFFFFFAETHASSLVHVSTQDVMSGEKNGSDCDRTNKVCNPGKAAETS